MVSKKRIRVSDFIAQFISNCGVKHVHLLSGGGMMYLSDGLAANKKIKPVCYHHEQAAAMAVDGYAKVTGNLGVGYFTTGPGAINAFTGTAGAYVDSVPSLYISGQAKRVEATCYMKILGIRQCGVQEINIMPMVKAITKYAAFIDKPEDIKYHLQRAIYAAKSGRPGPVWLDVPLDVQGAYIDSKSLRSFTPPVDKISKASAKDIKTFVNLLKQAKRPVILAGGGVRASGAIDNFGKFIKKYNIPVVTTYLGVDVITTNNPSYTGRIGIKGTRAGNFAVQNSDLLLVLGSSLPISEIGFEYSFFAREAKIVVVDIDKCSHQKKAVKIDLLIQADIDNFLTKTLKTLDEEKYHFNSKWLKVCVGWRRKYNPVLPEYRKLKKEINIYYFFDKLSNYLKSNEIVITDAGSVLYVGPQTIKVRKNMRYLTSGGFGAMGYSLPASIGASFASNKGRVICINGDGSFQQNIQELQTIIHHKLPIKIFIINNDGYLSIRFTQKNYFGRLIGEGPSSGVSFPSCKKIARAYGINYVKANKNSELDKALEYAFKTKGPVICEIISPKEQPIIPTVSSRKTKEGKMVSKPLEDMFPFLPREEFLKNMFVAPVEEE